MSPEPAGKPGPSQAWWGERMGCHAVPLERERWEVEGAVEKFTESKVHIPGRGIGRAEKERVEMTGKVKEGEGERQEQRERERGRKREAKGGQ